MSWIAKNLLLDVRECGCVGACDCADASDPHIQGAWSDMDEATKRGARISAISPISSPAGSGCPTTDAQRTPSPGRALLSVPTDRTVRAAEHLARENARPHLPHVDNVVPVSSRPPVFPDAA